MRQTPRIGPIESCFGDTDDTEPRLSAADASESRSRNASESPAQPDDQPSELREENVRSDDDTVSLDGMSIDEILAKSDEPAEVAGDDTITREDTGEWAAIEDMLSPDVMLEEGKKKKA